MDEYVYSVITTAHFNRLLKKLALQHPELVDRYEEALTILSSDPQNKSRRHSIKKLQGISAGEGQYRLRSGRFRFRYDIADHEVVLLYCGLRREDTY
jgi:mRNA-degrading endonuclease RelE of RelBE toxin-antitoxin system